MFVIVQPNY